MIGFMLGSSAIITLAGCLMIFAPQIIFRRNGMEPQTSVEALRTYRIGGSVLIGLAFILIIQLFSE